MTPRRLAPLSLRGKQRISQLEAYAALRVIHFMRAGDWLDGFHEKEIAALAMLHAKLSGSLERAERASIPKGMRVRPPGAATIWDGEPPRPPDKWAESWKPWEETKAGRRARRWLEERDRAQKALAAKARQGRTRRAKRRARGDSAPTRSPAPAPDPAE